MGRNKRGRRKAEASTKARDREFVDRTSACEYQNPFTWELVCVSNDKGLKVMMDSVQHRGSHWATALSRIHCAYQFYTNGNGKKARELLEENYEVLVQGSCDDLLAQFRPALKHVLDSTWLRVRLEIDVPLPDGSSEEDVVKFSALDESQRAAVWAIRSTMADDKWLPEKKLMKYGYIKKALELTPNEGQWKCYLGTAMLQSRDGFGSYKEEVILFEEAFRLRQNPDTFLGLATALMFEDTADSNKKCVQLAKRAMEEYPESPYVFLDCARIWDKLSGRYRDARQAEVCLRKAIALAPKWKLAHLHFGAFCRSRGHVEEGLKHLRIASEVHEDAVHSLLPGSSRVSEDDLEFFSYFARCSPLHIAHLLCLHSLLDDMM